MDDKPAHGIARLASVVAMLLLGAVPAHLTQAQDDEIWQTIFRGRTEVNVVSVDVVVTDREGNPVRDLQPDDFELYVDGQPVEIGNFYAVVGGRPILGDTGGPTTLEITSQPLPEEPAERPLHLILYVDNANLTATHRARVFDRLREFLLANRQLGARIMLLSNDHSLVLRQGLTSTPHDIFVALSELEKTATNGPRFDVDRREIVRAIERVNVEAASGVFGVKGDVSQSEQQAAYEAAAQATPILNQIRAYSAQRSQHNRKRLAVLRQLIDTAAGMPGRKTVLYVSDGLSLRPGASLFEAYARRFESIGSLAGQTSADAEAIRDDITPELDRLLQHANASRVTFYTFDASPAASLEHGAAGSDQTSGGNFASWNDSMASTEQANNQDSLRRLAAGTGGRFAAAHSAYDTVFAGLVNDFEHYYSLGFIADSSAETEPRKLEVKVRGQGLTAHHRSSYRDKPVVELAAERAQAALLLDHLENPFEIVLATEQPSPRDDGTYTVPLRVQIPIAKMVLLPGKTDHQGRLSMFVAVRDTKGRTSGVHRHLCPVRIPNADVLTALGSNASCGVQLQMRPGPQRIAVSVLDELTNVDSTAYLVVDVGAGLQQAALASSPQ